MKILLLEKSPEIKIELLDYLKKDNQLFTIGDNINNDEIDVIIIRSAIIVDRKLLDLYKNLKYIFRAGVGLDNIDIKECKKRGIQIVNTPGANSNSVAEIVIGGILNLRRNLNFEFEGLEYRFGYMGYEISGKIVSIIGFGNIGKKVYERLLGFGVKEFLIYDPFVSKEDIEKMSLCKKVDDKKEIFKNSDIISFHIPLLDSTRNFLGQKEIKLLKNNVTIVNTSRGGIINENKLIDFLYKNPDSGLYMDVWEEEPNDPKIEFLELNNVLITPHIGGMSVEAEKNMHIFNI